MPRLSLGLGASLQHPAPMTWWGPLLPWLAQQKTLLFLTNSTNMQMCHGEDVRVKRDYKNAATLEANLVKLGKKKTNPNSPKFTFGTQWTAKEQKTMYE